MTRRKTPRSIAEAVAGAVTRELLTFATERVLVRDERSKFLERLRAELAKTGVKLEVAELGRSGDQPLWVLTLALPGGSIVTVHAPLERGTDPTGLTTADEIALRFFQHLLRSRSEAAVSMPPTQAQGGAASVRTAAGEEVFVTPPRLAR